MDFLESQTTLVRKHIFFQVSSDIHRKLTIYTANAGPTDLPESQNRKFLKSAEPAPPIGPPVRTPRDHPDHRSLKSLKVEGLSHPKIVSGGSGGAHTRENDAFAGETSNLESPKIQKIGELVSILLES